MEVTHRQGSDLDDAHVWNGLPVLVQFLNGCDDIVHVLLVQLAAVDSKAQHIAQLFLLPRGFRSYSME